MTRDWLIIWSSFVIILFVLFWLLNLAKNDNTFVLELRNSSFLFVHREKVWDSKVSDSRDHAVAYVPPTVSENMQIYQRKFLVELFEYLFRH